MPYHIILVKKKDYTTERFRHRIRHRLESVFPNLSTLPPLAEEMPLSTNPQHRLHVISQGASWRKPYQASAECILAFIFYTILLIKYRFEVVRYLCLHVLQNTGPLYRRDVNNGPSSIRF